MTPSIDRHPSSSRYAPEIGFSAAVRGGDWVVVSGMTAIDPDGDVVGGADPYEQAREAMRKIAAALEAAGATPAHVVQTRVYLTDRAHWQAVGHAHGETFREHPPAATMVVAELLDERMLVEIEAIAYVGTG